MSKIAILSICAVLVFNIQQGFCMTPEQRAEIHAHFEKLGMECIEDNQITAEDIENLRNHKVPTGPAAPCFMACVMRKIGLLDDQGMLQKETVLDHAKKVFNDPEEIANIGEYLHTCSTTVNSEAVSDGTKGCDRAFLGFKCMLEHSSKFGIDV